MKVKIRKSVFKEVEMDISFPYYYKHDLSEEREYTIYGKILSPEREVTIRESFDWNDNKQYEIEEDKMSSSYFDESNKSSKEEFEGVKKRALTFLSSF